MVNFVHYDTQNVAPSQNFWSAVLSLQKRLDRKQDIAFLDRFHELSTAFKRLWILVHLWIFILRKVSSIVDKAQSTGRTVAKQSTYHAPS